MGDFSLVDLKLDEARDALSELDAGQPPRTFQRRVHAFLAAARSVLQITRFQFGLTDLRRADRAALLVGDVAARKSFDDWFSSDSLMQAAWRHPLTDQRDRSIHRTGQARVEYEAPLASGVTVTRGNASHRPLVLVLDERTAMPIHQQPLGGGPLGARGLRVGIPLLTGASRYVFPLSGGDVEAIGACREYLSAIEAAVEQARPRLH